MHKKSTYYFRYIKYSMLHKGKLTSDALHVCSKLGPLLFVALIAKAFSVK